jgi:mannosyltransferase OCH1-like enzyme
MIPSAVHQIWLSDGTEELLPHDIELWTRSVREVNTGLSHTLWNKQAAESAFPGWVEYFGLTGLHYAFQADVLRLLILNTYGGFYLDADCEAHASLSPLTNCTFITNLNGVQPGAVFNNEFMGSVAEGNVISKLLSAVQDRRNRNELKPELRYGYMFFQFTVPFLLDEGSTIISPSTFDRYLTHHYRKTWQNDKL